MQRHAYIYTSPVSVSTHALSQNGTGTTCVAGHLFTLTPAFSSLMRPVCVCVCFELSKLFIHVCICVYVCVCVTSYEFVCVYVHVNLLIYISMCMYAFMYPDFQPTSDLATVL